MHHGKLLSIKEVASRCCVSPSTAARYAVDDKFPRPFRLSSGCKRWREDEILAWLSSRRT